MLQNMPHYHRSGDRVNFTITDGALAFIGNVICLSSSLRKQVRFVVPSANVGPGSMLVEIIAREPLSAIFRARCRKSPQCG